MLALALGASPADAQSRERAPQRHGGSYRQSQPARQGPSRDVGARSSVRGPNRGVVSQRSAVRTFRGPDTFRGGYVRSYSPSRNYYGSRGYGRYGYSGRSYAVPRHYEQRRHGGVYRSSGRYYRPVYRPYYRPYYRTYYPRSSFYFGYGYGWYPYSFVGYPYLYPGFYGYGWGYGHPYGPYGYGPYYGSGYAEDQGGIRLQMNPKQAEVFADGYYVGTVDDFDGMSQRLALDAGHHKIEVRADGYEPFAIDVNILRAQTIKYKGALRPR